MTEGVLYNHQGEVLTRYHVDQETDDLIVQRVQDVEPIIERNKRQRNANIGANAFGGKVMEQVASIPLIAIEMWSKEDGVDYMRLPKDEFMKRIRSKLIGGDCDAFRVSDRRF